MKSLSAGSHRDECHRLAILRHSGILLVLLCCAGEAFAVCGGSSPNRVAASASRADVLDCVNAASSGDTITVPAGTATWSSPVSLSGGKNLEIIGATVVSCTGGTSSDDPVACSATNNTTITCGTCFDINVAATQRISGFTMLGLVDAGGITFAGNPNSSNHFRVDHNRMVSNGSWARLNVTSLGNATGTHIQGIFDHNVVINISFTNYGAAFQWDDSCSTCQHQLWAQQPPLGRGNNVVFIEANHFQPTSANINMSDGNQGARQVVRFNRATGASQGVFEWHGMQGNNRGPQMLEVYHNNIADLGSFYGTAFFRGGTGVIFGNRQAPTKTGVLFTNDRSEYDEPAGSFDSVKECGVGGNDGNSPAGVDQQTPGQNGWRCRDQVGVGYDSTQWSHSPFGPYAQVAMPVYAWENLGGGSAMTIAADTTGAVALHIRANRDFYNQVTSFNGTVGVGIGPIASRPSTCTAGVAYWATDVGEWNSLHSGADGGLYKCTATNTWTLYYTPHTYPHPWTAGSGGGATLPAPANLRVVP